MGRQHKRKGFTLIEILIAVTILLAVSFVGVIRYANMVEENNVKIDIINAKTIADGINIAILSDAIDDSNVSNKSIIDDDLDAYFDTKIKPKSKACGGKNGAGFTYSIENKKVSIEANGIELYPSADIEALKRK